jgi:ADP-heptose:LPS heptosyltransferase
VVNPFVTNPPRSILAIDAAPFGPSLALLPAMRALRLSRPKTLLVAAASTGICELLNAYSLVDDTIDLKVIKPSEPGYADPVRRIAALLKRVRRYDFDLTLDFSPRVETQIAARLIVRSRTITPSKPSRLIDMLAGWTGTSKSMRQSAFSKYQNVLSQAGVDLEDVSFGLELREDEHARFEHWLAKAGSRGSELLILLHSSNLNDSWPASSFAELGRRLSDTFDARLIALDEPRDRAFTTSLGLMLPPSAINLQQPGGLQFVAALARASIVITDETMIARLACELDTPSIEIANALAGTAGSPVHHKVLEGASRKRVTTDEVFEAACEMIHKDRSPALFHRR